MSKYGDTALRAVELAMTTGCTASDAWNAAASEMFANSPSSQEKVCPREAFLGLVDASLIVGLNPEAVTTNRAGVNREYVVAAAKLLISNPALADSGPAQLWRTTLATVGADLDKVHNRQMDVVLALWEAGRIVRTRQSFLK
ncbi:MAG: hypothetical protein R3F18_18390 [Lysobacterales bacterium]|nr:hypothetical protein [Xanthomonadales bacterium]